MRIVDYLYDNQCTLRCFSVEASTEGAKSLVFTRSGAPVSFSFKLEGDVLHWEAPHGRAGCAKSGRFFRLNPFDRVEQVRGITTAPRQRLQRIVSAAKGVANQTSRIVNHFFLGGMDVDTRGLSRDLLEGILSPGRSREGGFVCRWSFEAEGKARVDVVDYGGILDDNPNVEGQAEEPRVMTNYYADGYAAYLFLRRYKETGDEQYFSAGIDNLEFLLRTYEGYPRGLTWMHHEFKNPAFLECVALLKQWGRLPENFIDNLKRLRVDRYEPTNVYALRYYWKVLLRESGGRADERRIQTCRDRLLKDQTADGLIMDNNPPMYLAARDLTYHQYSLACLAGALDFGVEDDVIRDIFIKGCEFSRAMLLGNGEVSYNGRGANNIYHIASAIYAFSFAHRKYGFEVGSLEPMFERLTEFTNQDGSLPTALNLYGDERMAWNHCRTPYNALTAFLLLKAEDAGLPSVAGAQGTVEAKKFFNESGYGIYRCDAYEAVLFYGLSESYVYSGAHRTGVSGLAAFLPNSGKPLNLILNRSLRDGGALATDLPTIIHDGCHYEPIGGQLSETESGFLWRQSNQVFTYERAYCFEQDGLKFIDRLEMKQGGVMKVQNAFGWPLNSQAYSYELNDKFIHIKPMGGDRCGWALSSHDTPLTSWGEKEIVSNPRGRGVMLSKDFAEVSVLPKDVFTWEISLMKEWQR